MAERLIRPIARIRTDYDEKFGIPRQSGLAPASRGLIIFEPGYRLEVALKGIEEFSHLWLIWDFSEVEDGEEFRPTVRPPKLGVNERKGVFATRSPFRPNRLGLSSVELLRVVRDIPEAPALLVAGADILDGTAVYDVKPYIPYTDAHPEARGSFAQEHSGDRLRVVIPEELAARVPEGRLAALKETLALDPRGRYEKRPGFVYGMSFAGADIRFTEEGGTITVTDIKSAGEEKVKGNGI